MNARGLAGILIVVLGLTGCVTKENYNAQVLRANNFQRLLAEEEKRSVELSAESAKLKAQVVNLEATTKALTTQFEDANAQVVRSLDEVGRLQDDLSEARATATILSGARSAMPKASAPKLKKQVRVTAAPPISSTSSSEPPDRLDELQPRSAGAKKGTSVAPVPEAMPATAAFRYHDVKKGETLADIAKRYKTDAQTVRELNDMAVGDAVRPGDRLIVGRQP